ncbi:MAG: hypothetical protein AB1649_07825 [Chloroflexota bacterium]
MSNSDDFIKLDPARVLTLLLTIIVVLIGFSVWGQYLRFFPERIDMHGAWEEFAIDLLSQSFYMDTESSVPTYFNTIMLFLPALLLTIIALWKNSRKDRFRFHWTLLALLFVMLSMDEAAALHERLIKPVRAALNLGGVFYFAWIIPGFVFVGVLALTFIRFFLHLDSRFKVLFFFSLALYFGGVLGGEMISGYFAESLGQKNFTYAVVASFEESIEMIGASLFTFSLLKYMRVFLHDGIKIKV